MWESNVETPNSTLLTTYDPAARQSQGSAASKVSRPSMAAVMIRYTA